MARVKTTKTTIRAVSVALAGAEKPYPHYRFSGRTFLNKPNHNPFLVDAEFAPLIVGPTQIPDGQVNVAYVNQQFTATGGFQPNTWSLASGTLPDGMTFSTSGLLSGTPTENAGRPYPLRIQVIDDRGNGDQIDVSFDIIAA